MLINPSHPTRVNTELQSQMAQVHHTGATLAGRMRVGRFLQRCPSVSSRAALLFSSSATGKNLKPPLTLQPLEPSEHKQCACVVTLCVSFNIKKLGCKTSILCSSAGGLSSVPSPIHTEGDGLHAPCSCPASLTTDTCTCPSIPLALCWMRFVSRHMGLCPHPIGIFIKSN